MSVSLDTILQYLAEPLASRKRVGIYLDTGPGNEPYRDDHGSTGGASTWDITFEPMEPKVKNTGSDHHGPVITNMNIPLELANMSCSF
jgi:hypothetical protein